MGGNTPLSTGTISILATRSRGPDEDVEHLEYLHRDTTNPMLAIVESLDKNIGDKGSILVWHQSFEKARNNEMGEFFQNLQIF